MSDRSHLMVVAEGAKPTKRKAYKNITESLDGTSRDVLAAMRKALAKKLDDGDVSSNSIASAYKELRELDRLIRQLDAAIAEAAKVSEDIGDAAFDASAI